MPPSVDWAGARLFDIEVARAIEKPCLLRLTLGPVSCPMLHDLSLIELVVLQVNSKQSKNGTGLSVNDGRQPRTPTLIEHRETGHTDVLSPGLTFTHPVVFASRRCRILSLKIGHKGTQTILDALPSFASTASKSGRYPLMSL